MRSFNTAGPCVPDEHYMLPAEPRLPGARQLVEQRKFFVVHAPRQSGKTTSLGALARDLRARGYAAIRFSCEAADTPDDVEATEDRILEAIRVAAENALPPEAQPPAPWPGAPPGARLRRALTDWARACPRQLVLLFDEIDALTGRPLLNVLRQLRDGYTGRPDGTPFVSSAVLCGMRDVRDYRMAEGRDPDRFASSSPFNISAGSLRLADFTSDQVAELYAQHTAETGQQFTPEAVAAAFECTAGQPWLVNAIASEIITGMGVPVTETITAGHVEQARQRLIVARATHLDSLAARLDEPRILRVIDPLLAGTSDGEASDAFDDDLQYVRDLGLIAATDPVRIASPMYRDIIVRTIAASSTASRDGPRRWQGLT